MGTLKANLSLKNSLLPSLLTVHTYRFMYPSVIKILLSTYYVPDIIKLFL